MNNTTTKPYDGWAMFIAKGTEWLNKSKGNKDTKLGYAMTRMIDRVQAALKKAGRKYENELEALRITHCKVGDKGEVLINPVTQGYEYDKDELLKLRKAQDDLSEKLLATEIEIECYFATDVPEFLFNHVLALKADTEMLTGAEVEAFSGIVLDDSATPPHQAEPEKTAVAQVQ